MKKMLVILGLVMLFVSCSSGEKAEKNQGSELKNSELKTEEKKADADIIFEQVSGEKAKELVENEEAILVDVRTKEEYDNAHIDGALLVPLGELKSLIVEKVPDKDSGIILYCRSGNRSGNAANILKKMGYTKIYDMGPMTAWK